jgi:hypothetical protein
MKTKNSGLGYANRLLLLSGPEKWNTLVNEINRLLEERRSRLNNKDTNLLPDSFACAG